MFTGIVEELGEIVAVERLADAARLTVRGPRVTAEARHGDSIAVNGVCLTVTDATDKTFTADVMAETLHRTGLGALAPGSPVNLERPVQLGGRLGGHLVQGHADGTGVILSRAPASDPGGFRGSSPRASTAMWSASRCQLSCAGTWCSRARSPWTGSA